MSREKQKKAPRPPKEKKVRKEFYLRAIKLGRLFSDHRFVLIFSIVCAIGLWFFMVLVVYPEETRTFRNVPVDVAFTDSQIEQGFRVSQDNPPVIDEIVVQGGRFDIAKLSVDDIQVSVRPSDVSSIESEGEQTKRVLITYPDGISEVRKSSETVTFRVEIHITREFTVEIDDSNITAADGYKKESPVSDYPQISVTGSRQLVDRIRRVVAITPEQPGPISSATKVTSVIQLLDADGNLITGVQPQHTEMDVTIGVQKIKKVPLAVEFKNVPADYESSPLKYTISPITEIELYGRPEDIDNLDELVVGTIDFNEIGAAGSQFDFDIATALEKLSGIKNNKSTIVSVTVTIDGSALTSRVFNVSQFVVLNAPSGTTITPDEQQLGNVTVVGPANLLSTAEEGDVVAVIDMKGKPTAAGKATTPVSWIRVKGKDSCWIQGDASAYPVSITVQ